MAVCVPQIGNRNYARKILKKVKETKNDVIHFYQPEEYEVFNWEMRKNPMRTQVKEYLKKNKCTAVYWCANFETDEVISPIQGMTIKNWPLYTVHWSWHTISWKTVLEVTNPSKLFICLNNIGHDHRCLIMDEIHRRNIQDDGYLSWHDTSNNYDWKYFDNRQIVLDEFHGQWKMAPQQFDSLWNIIGESNMNRIDITEKTFYAMMMKKPFLILAKRNINKRLKHFGFRLFEDHIDYAFDSKPGIITRTRMMLDEIEKFRGQNYTTLYEEMREVCEHNYNRCREIVHDRETVPDEFYEIFDELVQIPTNYSPGVARNIYEHTLSNPNS